MEMKITGIALKKTICQRYFNKAVTHTHTIEAVSFLGYYRKLRTDKHA